MQWIYRCLLVLGLASWVVQAAPTVVFETTSAYHHIQVVDEQGVRRLTFNGTLQTQMSLRDPRLGHLGYTEYFHLPWLWTGLTNVLMVGLGGGSTQRSYQLYYGTNVTIGTVEIDPVVVDVAKRFFFVKETPQHTIQIADGRLHLRRSQKKYDAILMDAYAEHRYGAYIPYHLVTREFFELANEHLSERGVLAYNVIGTLGTWRSDLVAAIYLTMKSVFPQVYIFPVDDTLNVVLIATKDPQLYTLPQLQQRARAVARQRRLPPSFPKRVNSLWTQPIALPANTPILTDDFAPVDGLLRSAVWQ